MLTLTYCRCQRPRNLATALCRIGYWCAWSAAQGADQWGSQAQRGLRPTHTPSLVVHGCDGNCVVAREVFVLDGYIRSMRFAVSLFVIAVGAIFAFGVADSPDDSVRVHLIGLILTLTGLVGLAMAFYLFVSRRRTDIVYRENGATWLEPNAPAPGESWGPVERHGLGPLPERYVPTVHVPGPRRHPVHRRELLPAASIVRDPQTGRVARVHGVMDVEPGSAEFRRMAELYEE